MQPTTPIPATLTRAQKYELLIPQIKAVIQPETDLIANLANTAALIYHTFNFLWVGFYRLLTPHELVLAPFQGTIACTRIPLHKGVCGHAAATQKTVIVPNVHLFEGHIACSSLSSSEIVVPLVKNNQTVLVLDIDSTQFNDFNETDALYLQQIMELLYHKV